MGLKQRHYGRNAGRDYRQQYASDGYDKPVYTEEQLEAAMEEMIEQAHCRLLERATGGLLTWQGDRIVQGQGARRSRAVVCCMTADVMSSSRYTETSEEASQETPQSADLESAHEIAEPAMAAEDVQAPMEIQSTPSHH